MKLKFFILSIATALVAQSVVSQDTCDEKCTEECTCPERKTCGETEIDCGPSAETPEGHCDPDRICVASNCQCPKKDNTGVDCPLECNIQCGETELLCPGPLNSVGCKTPDSCVAKGMGTDGALCPGVCPVTCDEGEIHCPKSPDENGCAQAPDCVAKGKDKNGLDCPGVCPVVCGEDELLCGGKDSDEGCRTVDACVNRGTNTNGDSCAGACPVECQESEVHCIGPVMPDGCKMPDVCHPTAKNVDGENCPDNSASHNCPVSCMEHQTLCPGTTDALGCKGPDECTDKTKNSDGEYCPATSVCHVPCKINEISCAGGMDSTGCKKPDECHPIGRDTTGALCETFCPGECSEDELLCPGKLNEAGCKEADICMARGIKSCGPDVGAECNGYCPIECAANEIKCASQSDPCDCCPTEEVCRPAAKNINGVFCDADSSSHNCPVICDEQNGEVLCPGYEDELGCKTKAICIGRSKDPEGNYCPAHSVCPMQCAASEMLCSDGYDHDGCKNADRCLPRGSDTDGNFCPILCPPVCNDDTEVYCPGGINENGCKNPGVCIAKTFGNDGAQCRTACPITCDATEIKVPGGTDDNGCPEEDICGVPKTFGPWENVGACQANGENPECGPGVQAQIRSCTDGIIEKCTEGADTERSMACAATGTALPACPPPCTNGEVKLEEDGTPLVLWDDRWYPICGHFFWDNLVGASMFCSKLGYGYGEMMHEDPYSSDAFRIGKCEESDDWNHCTGGCNDYELGGTCGNSMFGGSCATDEDVAITITCSQPSSVVFNPSCTAYKQLGDWSNDGNCEATGEDKTCGPGIQKQIRNCIDGVTNKCVAADTEQSISCTDAGTALPACVVEKQLGEWTNEGECVATGAVSSCGPGTQAQTRTCTDGSIDLCTDMDTSQTIPCSDAGTALPACEVAKQLGEWTNEGECIATGDDPTCGPGTQAQTRTCTDGTTDLCTAVDTTQTIPCSDAGTALPACEVAKQLGEWTNEGECIANGDDPTCGLGAQAQTRTCTDGTTDLCTAVDTTRNIPCSDAGTALPACEVAKQLGEWTNEGECIATGDDPTCGPGNQAQSRTCTDGTTDLCTPVDTTQTIPCSDAGTALPACEVAKQLGEWANEGECIATGDDPTCGPGTQAQTRACTDGTTDLCTATDTAQTVSCSEAGTALPLCS